jgi:type I restriction enzyme S subunit
MNNSDNMPQLYQGWIYAQLGDLIEPSKEKINPIATDSSHYIGLEHIEKDTGKILSYGRSEEVTSTKSIFHEGDLLYGKLRPYLNKVCISDFNGVCSTDILVFKKQTYLSNKYLKYRMLCPDFVRFANQNATGVNHPRVDFKKISTFVLALLPLAEQRRIVAKIEELFTKLDAGMESLKKAKEQLKQCRRQILIDIFNNKMSKYEWVELSRIADVSTGATPLRSNKKYFENGTIPWITSGALNELFVTKADEYITELALEETNAKIFPKNTLLIALYGEGKTRGKVSEQLIEAATNQACAAIIFKEAYSHHRAFVKLFLRKNYEDIRKLSSGGVQPNLNLSIIKKTKVPLPPINVERDLLDDVEVKFSIINNIEKAIDHSLAHAETLRQSILAQAFSGKLVPQDPNDEPAEKLLERIRAERAEKAGGKSGAGGKRSPRQTAIV